MEREFNAKTGFNTQHERLPRFFYTQEVTPDYVTFQVKYEDLDEVFNW